MLYARAADLTAIVHAAFIVFVLTGGFLAWRWPRLVWVHLPAVAVTAVIFLLGADCPLTDLERHFRREAGQRVYRDGFVAHYLLPMVPDTVRTVGVPVFVVAVTVAAYVGYYARHRAGPGRGLGGRAAPTTSRR
jgi:hypothetical protein